MFGKKDETTLDMVVQRGKKKKEVKIWLVTLSSYIQYYVPNIYYKLR